MQQDLCPAQASTLPELRQTPPCHWQRSEEAAKPAGGNQGAGARGFQAALWLLRQQHSTPASAKTTEGRGR